MFHQPVRREDEAEAEKNGRLLKSQPNAEQDVLVDAVTEDVVVEAVTEDVVVDAWFIPWTWWWKR